MTAEARSHPTLNMNYPKSPKILVSEQLREIGRTIPAQFVKNNRMVPYPICRKQKSGLCHSLFELLLTIE
jgi:hypothetical protein